MSAPTLIRDMSAYNLRREHTALLILDMQERLLPAIEHGDEITKTVAMLLEGAAVLNLPVFYTEQYPKGLGPTVQPLRDRLSEMGVKRFEKVSFCALQPELVAALGTLGRHQIILCGVETHICVWQTCRALLRQAYGVHIPADAVGSRRNFSHSIALDGFRQMGAVVTSAETALFDLLKTADCPEFKAISRLVK